MAEAAIVWFLDAGSVDAGCGSCRRMFRASPREIGGKRVNSTPAAILPTCYVLRFETGQLRKVEMIEIAGLVISGLGLLNDLVSRYKDLTSWTDKDLRVDNEWLPLAIEKGQLSGTPSDYVWARLDSVPTIELRGARKVVLAHNDEKKILYRIVLGRPDDCLVLMKKIDQNSA